MDFSRFMVDRKKFIIYGLRDFRIQGTMAYGESQAVMQVLIRSFGEKGGRFYANKLKREGHDLSDFAVEVPEIFEEDGSPVSVRDRTFLEPYFLAQELAAKDGGNRADDYFDKAVTLLEAGK